MSDWKLDLETYGLPVEEEQPPSAVWTVTRNLVTALWFQNTMSTLVFVYLMATSVGMVLGTDPAPTNGKNSSSPCSMASSGRSCPGR